MLKISHGIDPNTTKIQHDSQTTVIICIISNLVSTQRTHRIS